MEPRVIYRIRVRLIDRPGSLGRVTSRIGALRGDVIDLEVVERCADHAIDELVVSFPPAVTCDLIIREIDVEDGVHIEGMHPIDPKSLELRLDPLEAVATLLGSTSLDGLLQELCHQVVRCFGFSWALVVDEGGAVSAATGDLIGREALQHAPSVDDEWIPLSAAGLALVVGRDTPVLTSERQRLVALVKIVDRWCRHADGCHAS